MLGEDIFRIEQDLSIILWSMITAFLNSRRKFVSQIGLGLAAIPFILIYGITIEAQL
jgi:hypothetical protein